MVSSSTRATTLVVAAPVARSMHAIVLLHCNRSLFGRSGWLLAVALRDDADDAQGLPTTHTHSPARPDGSSGGRGGGTHEGAGGRGAAHSEGYVGYLASVQLRQGPLGSGQIQGAAAER